MWGSLELVQDKVNHTLVPACAPSLPGYMYCGDDRATPWRPARSLDPRSNTGCWVPASTQRIARMLYSLQLVLKPAQSIRCVLTRGCVKPPATMAADQGTVMHDIRL